MSNPKTTGKTLTTSNFSSINLPNITLCCQAQMTKACQNRGGHIELDYLTHKNTCYCNDCARKIKQQQQSAEWKRNKRKEIGWKAYQEAYSPYPTKTDQQAYHREYMRQWRLRKKLELDSELLS